MGGMGTETLMERDSAGKLNAEDAADNVATAEMNESTSVRDWAALSRSLSRSARTR